MTRINATSTKCASISCAPFDLDDFEEKLNDKERTYELDDVEWYTFEIYDEEGVMLAGDL